LYTTYDKDVEKKHDMILSLGELLVDLVPDKEDMLIQDAGPVIKTASGSAGIFACAAALLGKNGGFIGKVGKDSLSRLVTNTLRSQGVDMSHVIESEEGQIGLAFIEYLPERRNYQYYRRYSVGSLLSAEDLDEEYIAKAFAVHFPGMLLELTPQMRGACERLMEIARKHKVLLSFDPNIRSELSENEGAKQRLMKAVSMADVVAPTLKEGQMITGKENIGEVLRALHDMGPRIVALTRDKDGLVLSRDGQVVFVDGIDEKPIDPTGAGDTLAAALCVGLRENMPLVELGCFCNCAGTLVITKKGAIGMALPTRAEVDALTASGVCKAKTVALAELL